MKTIEFSEQEAQVLIQLLDVAVKAQGLQAAQNALHLVSKIQTAFQPEVSAEEPKKEEAQPKKK